MSNSNEDHEIRNVLNSLGASVKPLRPLLRSFLTAKTLLVALFSASGLATVVGCIAEVEFTGVHAAVATFCFVFSLVVALLTTRAIKLKDKAERDRLSRLIHLQDTYWTLNRAAVVEVDVDRHGLSPKIRVYVYNRGPDPIRMGAFRYALLPDPRGPAGLVADRFEASRITTEIAPERRELAFEATIGGLAPTSLFRIQRCSLLASFPLRQDGGQEKQIQELQPCENPPDAPEPTP